VRAAERLDGPVDLCLVTVKATQLDAALDRVPPEVLGRALLVPLLNGVEHTAVLTARYPEAFVVAGTIRVESTRSGPARCCTRARSPRWCSPAVAALEALAGPMLAGPMLAGRAPAGPVVALPRPGRSRLLTRCSGSGSMSRLPATSAPSWAKLGFLAPLALLTTHARAPAGVVREQRRTELLALIGEVAAVARAEGATGDEDGVLALFDQVPEGMRSSMQRDAAAGRPLELEAVGGAVLRAAARHRVPVPVTERLVEALRDRDRHRVRPVRTCQTGDPDARP